MNANIGMENTDNIITVNPFSKDHVSTEKNDKYDSSRQSSTGKMMKFALLFLRI
jgi:hypothetical protein